MPVSHVAVDIRSQVADKANTTISLNEIGKTPLKIHKLLASLKYYQHKDITNIAGFLHWSIGEKTKSRDILYYLDDFLF